MSTKETDKLTRWIVNLSPGKTFWIFGLFLPMYSIWLRQVGLYAINKNNRDNKLFNLLSTFFLVIIFILFFIAYGLQFLGNKMPDWMNVIVPIVVFLVWFTCNGIVSKNMIDYENRENEYFVGFRKKKEYIFRFFHLFYFPFSIYWLQKDVIKYNTSIGNK